MRAHLSYPNVMSTIAVVVALGGGTAVAGTLLTGRDIANSSLTGADIKNRSIAPRDLARAVTGRRGPAGRAGVAGPNGPQGLPGAKGDTGNTGLRGKSAFDALDSGQTVTGYERLDVESPNAGDFNIGVSLPGVAPANLEDDAVNFAPDSVGATADDDAACTGTAANPTAPAGKACLYVINTTNDASVVRGFDANTGARRRGFRAVWTDASTEDDVFLEFTWAYTAP